MCTPDVGVGLGVGVPHEGGEAGEEDVADDPQGPHVWGAGQGGGGWLWQVVAGCG